MVCLCVVGGGLISALDAQFEEAARLLAAGDFGAAASVYREILRSSPHHPDALHRLCVIAQKMGNVTLALQLVEEALTARSAFPEAHFSRSLILLKLGRAQEALVAARLATEMCPSLAEAWDVIGQILKNKGDYEESAVCHKKALALQPNNAHFYGNYALLLQAVGNIADAYRAAHVAASLDPSYPPMSEGHLLKAMGYPEKASVAFARVRALRPSFAEAAASEAMAYLQMGDWEKGLALWEQRPDLDASLAPLPLWQGQKIDTLLLYEDQGLGDAIHFMRYVSLLKERAKHIFLRVRAPLQRLCAEQFSDIQVIDETFPLPEVEARCRLSSLPFFFATRLNTVPAAPYLSAKLERRAAYRDKIETKGAPRIGVVWAGNAKFAHDASRSLPFSLLHPLLAEQAAHYIALQKDRLTDSATAAAMGMTDGAPWIEDFADTLAVVAELDLVVTVDTAVAHLAGALGKPVWILLAFDSDWRWLLGREDSPWYPSARLFRQRKPGDWAEIIERLAPEIRKLIAGDLSVLTPPRWNGESLRQNPYALSLPL